MIGYIYETTNLVNGKKYIGKRQSERFQKWYKGSGTSLKLAFEKYGKQNFSVRVLECCETEEGLKSAERKWIARYRNQGINLYNIAEGGLGGNMCDWSSFSPSKREEINRKNRLSHLGDKNGFYGKHHSEETKAIISKLNKGVPKSPQGANNIKCGKRKHMRAVEQVDVESQEVIRVWSCWTEACSTLFPDKGRTAYSHIAQCCEGKRNKAYGFRWRYAEVTL